MTILESLRGINAYPIPCGAIASVAESRQLPLDDRATGDVLAGAAYNLARADIFLWLSTAPDVSQGGQSYSFTDEQRASFRSIAYSLYREWGGNGSVPEVKYGYKGSRL